MKHTEQVKWDPAKPHSCNSACGSFNAKVVISYRADFMALGFLGSATIFSIKYEI